MSKTEWIKKVEENRRFVTKLLAADRTGERTFQQRNASYKRQVRDPRSAYWKVVCAGYAKAGATLVAFSR